MAAASTLTAAELNRATLARQMLLERAEVSPLDDFDLVYGYPWEGEEPMMRDLMRRYGAPGARLLLNGVDPGVRVFLKDRLVS